MTQLEVNIEDAVVSWAKKNKFLTPKVKFVEAGYPDRMFVSPYGHTIFIEFKKPGEEPTSIQYHRLNELQKRGVPATWVDNVHEAIGILKASLETAVGSPSISEEGDKTTVVAGVSRAIPRPGFGEDVNCTSDFQGAKTERFCGQDVNRSAAEASAARVAGGNTEVGRLLRPDVYNSTWGRKGSEPDKGR